MLKNTSPPASGEGNPFYRFLVKLIEEDYRMTVNEFAERFNLPSLGSQVHKLKTGKTVRLLPRTLRDIEEKVGIDVDISDLNHINYRKNNDDLIVSGAVHKIERLHSFLLIRKGNISVILQKLSDVQEKQSIIPRLREVITEEIALPYTSSNAVAGEVFTDMNIPLITPGDIVLADLDKAITDNCYCGVILKDGRYFIGKLTEYKTTAMFTFVNPKYNPVVVEKSEIIHLCRIVQIIKNI